MWVIINNILIMWGDIFRMDNALRSISAVLATILQIIDALYFVPICVLKWIITKVHWVGDSNKGWSNSLLHTKWGYMRWMKAILKLQYILFTSQLIFFFNYTLSSSVFFISIFNQLVDYGPSIPREGFFLFLLSNHMWIVYFF